MRFTASPSALHGQRRRADLPVHEDRHRHASPRSASGATGTGLACGAAGPTQRTKGAHRFGTGGVAAPSAVVGGVQGPTRHVAGAATGGAVAFVGGPSGVDQAGTARDASTGTRRGSGGQGISVRRRASHAPFGVPSPFTSLYA